MDGSGSRFSAYRASFRSVSINFDEHSITIPWVERGANRAHRRNIRRTQAPLAGGAMVVPQRVDDRAAIDVGRTPAVGRRGDDRRRESSPLFIGQIGRIVRLDRIEARGAASPIAPHLIRTAWVLS
jgi:hypothetical protein